MGLPGEFADDQESLEVLHGILRSFIEQTLKDSNVEVIIDSAITTKVGPIQWGHSITIKVKYEVDGSNSLTIVVEEGQKCYIYINCLRVDQGSWHTTGERMVLSLLDPDFFDKLKDLIIEPGNWSFQY